MTLTENTVQTVLDRLKDRDRCPIAGELKRKSKCTCVRDLFQDHRAAFQQALGLFSSGLSLLTNPDKQKHYVHRHLHRPPDPRNEEAKLLNRPQKIHLSLPVTQEPPGPQHICLCRSAAIDIVRFSLSLNFDDAEALFVCPTTLQRQQKKAKLMRILRYLLEQPTSPDERINWQSPEFRSTNISPNTALKYVREFRLREAAHQVVKCAPRHHEWVRDACGGHVLSLNSFALQSLATWRERAMGKGKYDSAAKIGVAGIYTPPGRASPSCTGSWMVQQQTMPTAFA